MLNASLKTSLMTALVVLFTACSNNNQGKESAASPEPGNMHTASGTPLSKQAQQGKALFASCLACHNQELDPPKAPPMFGVQKHYKSAYPDKQQFVEQLVAFVQNPTEEKALMKRPVRHLGLMPPQPLPRENLESIAHYIYEATFAPPCAHWRIAVKNAEAQGTVDGHIQKDKMKLQRFCQ